MWSILLASVMVGEPAAPRANEPVACTVVKTRRDERREGPSPALSEEDGATKPSLGAAGTLHFLTLRCGSKGYLVRLVEGAEGGSEPEPQPGAIMARFEGERVFLRRGQGAEREGACVETRDIPKREGARPGKPRVPAK